MPKPISAIAVSITVHVLRVVATSMPSRPRARCSTLASWFFRRALFGAFLRRRGGRNYWRGRRRGRSDFLRQLFFVAEIDHRIFSDGNHRFPLKFRFFCEPARIYDTDFPAP